MSNDSHFFARVEEWVGKFSPLLVGIDPHLDMIDPRWLSGNFPHIKPNEPVSKLPIKLQTEICQKYCNLIIDAVAEEVAVIKIQMAMFERLGKVGIEIVENLLVRAKEKSLLTIMDAKRGDVPSTAKHYAETYLDNGPLSSDALTVNPYLGIDSIQPFLELATKNQRGVIVLLKTSNPGSKDFQEILTHPNQRPLYLELAEKLRLFDKSNSGIGMVGVVVGATYPEEALEIRELLPKTWFLVPGLGAQGGSLESQNNFYYDREKKLGALFNFSRSVIFPTISSVQLEYPKIINDRELIQAIRSSVKSLKKQLL